MVLEGLDHIEVGPLTLGEAVLTVELELGRDDRVLTPAVHVKGGLRKDEGACIGHEGATGKTTISIKGDVASGVVPLLRHSAGSIHSTSHLEKTRVDDSVGTRGLSGATESVDGVGKSIDGIGVVEGLGTEGLVEGVASLEGRAVINVGIGLNDPDKLLAGVVEVELDLVRRGTDRLIAGELELLDEVLVGVLGHLAALIRVKENVVNIEGGGHERLLVGVRHRLGARSSSEGLHGPEALTNGAEIDVNLNFVVLYEPRITPPFGVFIGRSHFD